MTTDEVGAFLAQGRVCRLPTIGPDGPHVAPWWFARDRAALWLNSTFRSQRWRAVERDPGVSVVGDGSVGFTELRGVELAGSGAVASEVPRNTEPRRELAAAERRNAPRCAGVPDPVPGRRHAWLRVDPQKLVTWDFRESPAARPRREEP